MRQQYLLVEDVEDVGRSGEVITAKPGFARNYLVPQGKAVLANAHTLKIQARLREERAKRAGVDRKEGEELAAKIEGMALKMVVKVDPEGNMYGSVAQTDILHLFEQAGIQLEKKNVVMPRHLRELGVHPLQLKLKEGVTCSYTLQIISDATPGQGE
jgi:large subunit ribosomal protein L9